MINLHNKNDFEKSFLEDDLITNSSAEADLYDDGFPDENAEDYNEEYNEEIYKWLSIAVFIVWLASIIYL